jgi:hypothetical protein
MIRTSWVWQTSHVIKNYGAGNPFEHCCVLEYLVGTPVQLNMPSEAGNTPSQGFYHIKARYR